MKSLEERRPVPLPVLKVPFCFTDRVYLMPHLHSCNTHSFSGLCGTKDAIPNRFPKRGPDHKSSLAKWYWYLLLTWQHSDQIKHSEIFSVKTFTKVCLNYILSNSNLHHLNKDGRKCNNSMKLFLYGFWIFRGMILLFPQKLFSSYRWRLLCNSNLWL